MRAEGLEPPSAFAHRHLKPARLPVPTRPLARTTVARSRRRIYAAHMEVEARPGYELWRPNRVKSEAKVTRVLVAIVLLISAALILIITLGGWERLQGATVASMAIIWAVLYILFAFLVLRWNRGILPVAAALAIILAIFAVIAAPAWFARDKVGLDSPAL